VQDAHSQALRALQFRYGTVPEDSTIVVNTYEKQQFRTRSYTPNELERIVEDHAGKEYDVWTRLSVLPPGLDLPPGSRGTEQQTYGTSTLWVDLDPDGTAEWKQHKLEQLRSFSPHPSRIEDSGRGLYALWRIDFTEDWERAKRANKWLAEILQGDHCWDMARVLRLPGTLNPKPDAGWATEVYAGTWRYTLDDFGETDLDRGELELQSTDLVGEPLPLDFERRLQLTSKRLWGRIESEHSAQEAGADLKDRGSVDRSKNDVTIAIMLMRMGVATEHIYSVLTHPTWFSGSKWRDFGYDDSYVKATISRALSVTGETEETNPVIIGDRLLEADAYMYYLQDWYRYSEDGIYEPAADHIALAVQGAAGSKWRSSIESEVKLRMQPHARVSLENIPRQQFYTNVKNGMLNWLTGELEAHSPKWRSLNQVDARWDPEADTTEVDEFIANVIPEDSREVFWMFCGYCMYSDIPLPYRCLMALVGPKRTGKSTVLNAIRKFLGNVNCSSVGLEDLSGAGNQFTTSALVGRMLNVDEDAPYTKAIKDGHLLKKLADGGQIQVERKGHDSVSMELPIKLAFAMNGYPLASGADAAFYDRWIIIEVRTDAAPFTDKNPKTRSNAHIQLLASEKNRDAWLRRSVEGMRALYENHGFPTTEGLRKAKMQFMIQSDPVYTFWKEYTTLNEDPAQRPIPLTTYYAAYKALMSEQGAFPLSQRMFTQRTQDIQRDDEEQKIAGLVLSKGDNWRAAGRRLKTASIVVNGVEHHMGSAG